MPFRDIWYIEAGNHNCTVFHDGGSLIFRKNLSELEKELPQGIFLRCHRSYLVDIDRIRARKTKELVLENQKMVPISESYITAIEKVLSNKQIAKRKPIV